MKVIKINSCDECPYNGKCSAWKKLTSRQKITLTLGVEVKPFILKNCELQDYEIKKANPNKEDVI